MGAGWTRRVTQIILVALVAGCGRYEVEGPNAYYQANWRVSREKIDGADASTFTGLSRHHAKDQYRAYYQQWPIEGADAATFEEVDPLFSRDSRHVFFQTGPIIGADRASFEVVSGNIARDRRTAYLGASPRRTCDPASLRPNGAFMQDARCIYDQDLHTVPGIDRQSFRLITTQIGRDRTTVYTVLPQHWQGDGGLRRVEGICAPASLREEQGWLVDDRCVYDAWLNQVPGVDRASFSILSPYYAKDRNRVYAQDYGSSIRVADGAVPATFKPDTDSCLQCGRDRQHCFEGSYRRDCPLP